jgi:phage replication-related protein YjqB (UPF0714/DUF867 family)
MPKDWYCSFSKLQDKESKDAYRIVVSDRNSDVTIIAPHGGEIEPGTSEIAVAVAGQSYNAYRFEGMRKRPHHELHITSHKFDEPQGRELVAKSSIVIAIHGRKDRDDPESVYLGGLDKKTRDRIADELEKVDFRTRTRTEGDELSGTHPDNICNRGSRHEGVQLELPRSLRTKLLGDAAEMAKFAEAIRAAILGVT